MSPEELTPEELTPEELAYFEEKLKTFQEVLKELGTEMAYTQVLIPAEVTGGESKLVEWFEPKKVN